MLFWAFRQLCTPCNYLRIRHGEGILQSKLTYDFVLPGLLMAVTVGFTLWLGLPLKVFGTASVFQALSGLLAVLIGFYMAALAAVATFHREGIDQYLIGDDALLRVRSKDGGRRIDKRLTYRQFISYLFGYASFLSFVIYAGLLLASAAWPKLTGLLKAHKADWVMGILDPAAFGVVYFALWQLFVTSLLGIYFLADRLQALSDPDR